MGYPVGTGDRAGFQHPWGLILLFLVLVGCSKPASEERKPQQAGQPLSATETAARLAAIRGAALMGDQNAVRENVAAFTEDFRKSIKLADPARAVDRESARQAARRVGSVRSVAWIDRENLFVIVDSNEARTYQVIDQICIELESLGDTLGVVVNLQSGAASNGDELAILSRNCQLAPGEQALLSRAREVDVVDPEIRAQHRANQGMAAQEADDIATQRESMKALEASTPSVGD
jgi:hypothetical protein